MRKLNIENPILLALASALLAAALFYALDRWLEAGTYLHGFFFNFLPIQWLNSWLFLLALLFVLARSRILLGEADIVSRLRTADSRLNRTAAEKILESLPREQSAALVYRRIREVVKGYLHGEDVIRLNEELSQRDHQQVERGHLLIGSLRNIIPVVGFLGTVIGLSRGMAKFPQISAQVGNIDDLKAILQGFAADLSVAFDTTLLALAYTIVVILASSLLRSREEKHVDFIDDRVRSLIANLESRGENTVEVGSAIESLAIEIREARVANQRQLEGMLSRWDTAFVGKMDELIGRLAR